MKINDFGRFLPGQDILNKCFFCSAKNVASIIDIFQDNICGKTSFIIFSIASRHTGTNTKPTKLKPFFFLMA